MLKNLKGEFCIIQGSKGKGLEGSELVSNWEIVEPYSAIYIWMLKVDD